MDPALALLEFSSVARGIEAGDAMAKRAPVQVLRAGTVHPGRYLVLIGGATADVEEALAAGTGSAGETVIDVVFLPDVHPDVVASVGGVRRGGGEALGVIETTTVASVLRAADAGVKAARVVLRELRLADDLGGKGYVLFGGEVAEVETAVEAGAERVAGSGLEVARVVIARLHAEMDENLAADGRFAPLVSGLAKEPRATVGVGPRDVARPLPGSGGR